MFRRMIALLFHARVLTDGGDRHYADRQSLPLLPSVPFFFLRQLLLHVSYHIQSLTKLMPTAG